MHNNITQTPFIHLSAMSPTSCPPMAPLIEVHAPSQALLWKNSLMDVTSTLSVNFTVLLLRMMLKTDEKPLQYIVMQDVRARTYRLTIEKRASCFSNIYTIDYQVKKQV